jgi:dethiobiotin synthetase
MSMRFSCFVTGTDTGIGKTLVSSALLQLCRAQGWRAVGMKPVAAGCETIDGQWCNEDVETLRAASSIAAERTLINPYIFEPAIAPHIAAAEAGVAIDLEHVMACYQQLTNMADAVVVEGVGGFLVPFSATADSGDLARLLDLPVVLVVGMHLGCINHALLTQEAIMARGLKLVGWVANQIGQPMDRYAENVAALTQRLQAPLLGSIPDLSPPDSLTAAGYLRLPASLFV